MNLQLTKVNYDDLNSRQKENFNFQKVSAVLADFGFMTMRLSDDWGGADFIAVHAGGNHIKVQLKGRLTVDQKYHGKDIYIAFRDGNSDHANWYLYPHDEVCEILLRNTNIGNSLSWTEHHGYSFPYLTKQALVLLKPYLIGASA